MFYLDLQPVGDIQIYVIFEILTYQQPMHAA